MNILKINKNLLGIHNKENNMKNENEKKVEFKPTKITEEASKQITQIDEIMIEMYEREANYHKCLKDFSKADEIDTFKIINNYFYDAIEKNFGKNPYFDKIESFLFTKNFKKVSSFGNNILYKNSNKE